MLEAIERSDDPNVGNRLLREKGPKEALMELGEQVGMYWRDEFPFRAGVDRAKIVDPLRWWKNMANHDSAQVLGVRVPSAYMSH
jgi:hypothetical protein